MAEIREFSDRIRRLTSGRQPIRINGIQYWSPAYDHWFVNFGPVVKVRWSAENMQFVLAYNEAGDVIEVPALPDGSMSRKRLMPRTGLGTARLKLVEQDSVAAISPFGKGAAERAFRKMKNAVPGGARKASVKHER